jgi:hypothetical protein
MSTRHREPPENDRATRLQLTSTLSAAVLLLACGAVTLGVILLHTHFSLGRLVILIGAVVLVISGSLLGFAIHASGQQARLATSSIRRPQLDDGARKRAF